MQYKASIFCVLQSDNILFPVQYSASISTTLCIEEPKVDLFHILLSHERGNVILTLVSEILIIFSSKSSFKWNNLLILEYLVVDCSIIDIC